jgi:hypothetical protein
VIDITAVSETTAEVPEAVLAGWSPAAAADCPVISSATGAPDVFPMVNATARPATAAGTAAIGRRRLTVELVVLSVLPKRALPVKVALTRKAACRVHWVVHGAAAFGAPDITGA